MSFAKAMHNSAFDTKTTNGMSAFSTTSNPVVDLFGSIGGSRGKNITADFEKAYQHDSILATKVALWARDIRGGAGERQLFRDILLHLEAKHPEMLDTILPFVPEYGRFDDILIFKTADFRKKANALIIEALGKGNGLCAKWISRDEKKTADLREQMGLTPRQFRKLVSGLTKVVEQQMCAKEWAEINFNHVPSVASKRYMKAFGRNASEAYGAYIQALVKGEAKINASAVYPHDVVDALETGNAQVAQAQWDALPNYVGDASILPMVDVSGSMGMYAISPGNRITCMEVAIGLGLYLSDKNRGDFKDLFLTFSGRPELVCLKGNLREKYAQLRDAHWQQNTNLHAAFDAILDMAVKNQVPASDMPKTLLILSDMQFDRCTQFDDSAMQMIRRKYAQAGYEAPNVVFWNLNASGNHPVRHDESGVALVSGFSPAIMGAILGCEDFTPEAVMMKALNNPRYQLPWAV